MGAGADVTSGEGGGGDVCGAAETGFGGGACGAEGADAVVSPLTLETGCHGPSGLFATLASADKRPTEASSLSLDDRYGPYVFSFWAMYQSRAMFDISFESLWRITRILRRSAA